MSIVERELRAAILAAPDDLAPRLVYADWLLERGDPRGELIVLQCAEPDEARALRQRALWQRHGRAWLAEDLETADPVADRFVYRDGFLHSVQITGAELVALGPRLARHPIHTLRVLARPTELAGLDASPVLGTVRRLELVHRFDDTDALARLLSAPGLARLDSLVLDRAYGPTNDDAVWYALERCPRRAALVHLRLGSVALDVTRARWLAGSLPALQSLAFVASLDAVSLRALAGAAAFELRGLTIQGATVGDEAIAEALTAPWLRRLSALALPECGLGPATAARLPGLACSATLVDLDLGSQRAPTVARALADCAFPALRSLDLRSSGLADADLAALRRFPVLASLTASDNPVSATGAQAIVAHAPGLRALRLDDAPIGDEGARAIATAPSSRHLRTLHLGDAGLGSATVDAICGGQLDDLRELALTTGWSSPLADRDLARLASEPPSKLERLELRPVSSAAIERYFAPDWIVSPRTDWLRAERRVEPPLVSSARAAGELADCADLDLCAGHPLGARIRAPDLGTGIVVHVEAVRLTVHYPEHGDVTYPVTPPGARPFDPARAYQRGDVLVHPTRGPGIVLLVELDRLCVRFSSGDPEMVSTRRPSWFRRLFGLPRPPGT